MKLFIGFVLWCLLFAFSWPLAILALVLYPFVWLLLLPFRLIGITVGAVFALLRVILFLPAPRLKRKAIPAGGPTKTSASQPDRRCSTDPLRNSAIPSRPLPDPALPKSEFDALARGPSSRSAAVYPFPHPASHPRHAI